MARPGLVLRLGRAINGHVHTRGTAGQAWAEHSMPMSIDRDRPALSGPGCCVRPAGPKGPGAELASWRHSSRPWAGPGTRRPGPGGLRSTDIRIACSAVYTLRCIFTSPITIRKNKVSYRMDSAIAPDRHSASESSVLVVVGLSCEECTSPTTGCHMTEVNCTTRWL